MNKKSKNNPVKRFTSVLIGNAELPSGLYLPSDSSMPVKKRPDKKNGYAYYDGETLTLYNYRYVGTGSRVGNVNVGLDLSNTTTELVFRGENIIEIVGQSRAAALLVNNAALTIRGKGTLSLCTRDTKLSGFGMLGSGSVKITSGTLRLRAQPGEYTEDADGNRIYKEDSYAIKLEELVARLARIRGDIRVEDENGEKSDINLLNRNDETEVVIDFPRMLLWWWRSGCLLPLLLLLLSLAALLVAIWAMFFRLPPLEPDFNLLEIEQNAEEMDDGGKAPDSTGGGGAVVLNFSYDVAVNLTSQKATLYFGLPSQSNKDAVLQLVIGDVLLAQSGRLPPGYQISTLDVDRDAAERLQPGVYNGGLRVFYYDDETGERAILDTEIKVTVTVTR